MEQTPSTYSIPPKQDKNNGKKKSRRPIIIFGVIVIAFVIVGLLIKEASFDVFHNDPTYSEADKVSDIHIGVLYIEGVIGESDANYSQAYIIDAIDGMMENNNNKGMMLYINTPGGGVYESDEVYLKLMEYKKETERPVYVYMASQATSGGYYIAAASDKIYANRNCWTGSIGVIVGTLYDVSGLMEKYGIKGENITSGPNKDMGSITKSMTSEERAIWQSLVDEAYEQFVGIVAKGRNLEVDYVKSIADGRVYSAQQAKDIKLVDDVVLGFDQAIEKMQEECKLGDCEINHFQYIPEESLFGSLIKGVDKASDALAKSGDVAAIKELMDRQDKVQVQYMCEVVKE